MALVMAEATELGAELDRWIKRQRLGVAELSRLSDVSRRTIYNIGEGASVTSETLRKIARGLATDPHTGEIDRRVHSEVLRDLLTAGGFPPEDSPAPPNFEAEILRRVRDGATASDLAELLDRWPGLSPARLHSPATPRRSLRLHLVQAARHIAVPPRSHAQSITASARSSSSMAPSATLSASDSRQASSWRCSPTNSPTSAYPAAISAPTVSRGREIMRRASEWYN